MNTRHQNKCRSWLGHGLLQIPWDLQVLKAEFPPFSMGRRAVKSPHGTASEKILQRELYGNFLQALFHGREAPAPYSYRPRNFPHLESAKERNLEM